MLVRNASLRGPTCFRCMMVSVSGPRELLFRCNVISLYFMCFSFNGSVCLVCCVFDNVW